jgi:hypothetical protein
MPATHGSNDSPRETRLRVNALFRRVASGLVLLLFGWCGRPLLSQELNFSTSAKHIATAADVFEDWQPHQRLYVKGDVGVGEEQLDGLEAWLDSNATNWVVVLMESAEGEQFTDAEGESFRGMTAVEHQLGRGLPNRTDFGVWTEPRTGERSGAFFVLFLKERKFSYFGSDVYDNRRFGEDAWVGRLDRPAVAAMRGGGRIVDAVQDTVRSIDQQLGRSISAEIARREQEARQAQAAAARLQAEAEGV